MKSIKLFVAFVATLFSGHMLAQSTISANDVTIEKGQTADVTFTINSESKAAIAEFKLVLPEGIDIQYDDEEQDYVYDLGSSMTVKTHSATIKKQSSGAYYVLVSNSAGKEFKAATGDYLTVTLIAGDNAVSGVATMKDIIIGDIDAKQMNTETVATFNITVGGEVVETTYTIAGTKDLTGTDENWQIDEKNNMTFDEASSLYVWTAQGITVSNTVQPEFKVVNNRNEWFPASEEGNDHNWIITPEVLGGEGIYTITITFNPENSEINVTGEKTADITPVEPTTYTAYFINSKNWESVFVWVWNGDVNLYEAWPGVEATKTEMQKDGFDVYCWSYSGDFVPAMIIFNNGNNGQQTQDMEFVNGNYYDADSNMTTGINGVTVAENAVMYNLKGQRVMNAQKGLYIQNGKKVVK